jgi:hypothetical protein
MKKTETSRMELGRLVGADDRTVRRWLAEIDWPALRFRERLRRIIHWEPKGTP